MGRGQPERVDRIGMIQQDPVGVRELLGGLRVR